jgi:DNA helicase-2/ATP-dependent DNA helicase PcrA
LILTHAVERRLYGYPQANLVSRFIREIPGEAMDFAGSERSMPYVSRERTPWNTAVYGTASVAHEAVPLFPLPSKSGLDGPYYKGAVVKHAKFGLGTVQRSEGQGDDLKISVSFPGYGVKTLSVKFAKLEVV